MALPGGAGSFSPSRVFWLFLAQLFSADRACREVLRNFLGRLALEQKCASPRTAGYCKARFRLRQEDLDQVHRRLARTIEAGHARRGRWQGRAVKVVDGSGLSMPDTPANQQRYPQAKRAKPGCGFPVMRVAALFSLTTGVMIALARDALTTSERALFRSLWGFLVAGDVLLADRGFCGYAEFYFLLQRGVDCVMRNHQRRTVGKTIVKALGPKDYLIQWHKSKSFPAWPDRATWTSLPNAFLLRQISFEIAIPGFRSQSFTIVTTLLDAEQFPAQAFADLYRRRWLAELYLRDIKITIGMDVLRCKSPAMIDKELAMYQIAYNLTRALMLEAAREKDAPIERISFKGAIATIRQWAPLITQCPNRKQRRRLLSQLLSYLAQDQLPLRPNRLEPRARKRRAKNYQLLNKPRHLFKEIPHRNKYQKVLS